MITALSGKHPGINNDRCFHCGEDIPSSVKISVTVQGEDHPVCCPGCKAVAMTICEAGLENYYQHRSVLPEKPQVTRPDYETSNKIYDDPDFQKEFVRQLEPSKQETVLILEGLVCPACAWLNETHVSNIPGVISASVNLASGKLLLCWNPAEVSLTRILNNIYSLGYKAYPFKPGVRQALYEREKKFLLLRLGLAGLLGIQVMMIAVAMYAGDWHWMEDEHRQFFRWISLLLSTPVVVFSAQPFYLNSWRALRLRHLVMDVVIALGISLAFIASAINTIKGQGVVYFDSVVMLVFFLLIGRYLEFSARAKAANNLDSQEKIIPSVVTRLNKLNTGYESEIVPVNKLKSEEIILIKPGETIPVDGLVISGQTTTDESVITGESMPVIRHEGDAVLCGSRNIDSSIHVKVTAVGQHTSFSHICHLVTQAQAQKPEIVMLVDRITGWFLGAVLLISFFAAIYWWHQDPEIWLSVVIATLVATCPCALSMATPISLTVAINRLLNNGIAVIKSGVLQTMTAINHLVFDKTGTLTEGELQIIKVEILSNIPEAKVLAIAKQLESQSEHPIAKAFQQLEISVPLTSATAIHNFPGEGISGMIDEQHYYLGTHSFINNQTRTNQEKTYQTPEYGIQGIFLANDQDILAAFYLSDRIRSDACNVVTYFRERNIETLILSGDYPENVGKISREIGVDQFYAALKPVDKLKKIKSLQNQGAIIAMVGDGINDSPVLAGADVAIAMGSGTDMTQRNADIILLTSGLNKIIELYVIASGCNRIIKQNITWAIIYNLIALPAALAGLLAPWMAAIGMSLSSLLVVLNALRINKR